MRSNPCLRLLAVVSLLFVSTLVGATAQRTFVSSTGVDNAICSLVSPCRAFAAAITATTAGGEVIVLDSAGYGPVTITKAVSIIAPAGIYAGISVSSGDGITINAPGATVVLRGLTINGVGGASGVTLQQAARLRIESCVIANLTSAGIVHNATGAELIVLDSIVRDNAGTGILAFVDASTVLDHVRVEHNGGDGFHMASLNTQASATVTDSVFAFNGTNGIRVASTGAGSTRAQVERSVLADNTAAGLKVTATGSYVLVGVTRNTIHRNAGTGVAVSGTAIAIATVSENAILHNGLGLSADGFGTNVSASANSVAANGTADFSQANSANFFSYGNNIGANFNTTGTVTQAVGH